ncbi:unnamed protein product [Lasius platythorax]|uniref:Uncharacterized protein n=1 Tax=Lasius platythorax TaxID=488582 RepID=A0AAV2P657_9HYME
MYRNAGQNTLGEMQNLCSNSLFPDPVSPLEPRRLMRIDTEGRPVRKTRGRLPMQMNVYRHCPTDLHEDNQRESRLSRSPKDHP